MVAKRERKRDHNGELTPRGLNVNTSHKCYQVRLKRDGKTVQKTFRFDDQGLADAKRALADEKPKGTDEVLAAYEQLKNGLSGDDGISETILSLEKSC
jgi:hypothetical protein